MYLFIHLYYKAFSYEWFTFVPTTKSFVLLKKKADNHRIIQKTVVFKLFSHRRIGKKDFVRIVIVGERISFSFFNAYNILIRVRSIKVLF